MEKVSEMTTEPIVGKFYLVECALYFGIWTPIVGDKHSDPDIFISFEHYHKDIRFLPRREFAQPKALLASEGDGVELNRSLEPSYVRVIELKKRKCLRPMPPFPDVAGWSLRNRQTISKFQKRFAGRKVLCGKCPHKGFPLESLPKDESGHVICNGHGLKIDMNKGEVVKR